MGNPFKKGNRVICIKRPRPGTYRCAIGATATVIHTDSMVIYTKEDICNDWGSSNPAYACYDSKFFKLYKPTISFKQLKEY